MRIGRKARRQPGIATKRTREGREAKEGTHNKKRRRREKIRNIQVERQDPHTWDRGRGWSGTR